MNTEERIKRLTDILLYVIDNELTEVHEGAYYEDEDNGEKGFGDEEPTDDEVYAAFEGVIRDLQERIKNRS